MLKHHGQESKVVSEKLSRDIQYSGNGGHSSFEVIKLQPEKLLYIFMYIDIMPSGYNLGMPLSEHKHLCYEANLTSSQTE